MKIFTTACLLLLGSRSIAQLTGTVTVPSTAYPTLAAVVTALNAQGVGAGGVVISITAGNPQTAPAGGYLLGSATLNASTSSNKMISIQGNNNTVTANTGTSTTTDGIFVIQGTDYVSIQNLNLAENAANTTPTTQMEWGYALVKRSATAPFDGCTGVLIQGCTITLNRNNPASVGIYAGNHTAGSLAQLPITAQTDANNANELYADTIQNCYTGISFMGAAGTAFYDYLNNIGGSASVSGYGNTVRNFGGGTTAQTGIVAGFCKNATISNNTISNSAGGGVAGGNASLTGILYIAGTGTENTVANNLITLQQGSNAGAVVGIKDSTEGLALASHIVHNTISGSGGSTGTWYGIEIAGSSTTTSATANIFQDINTATTAALHLIHQSQSPSPGTIYITNNTTAGTAQPYVQKTGAGNNFAFYYNIIAGANVVSNIGNNTVAQVQLTGGTTFYGIYSYDVTAAGTKTVYNNTVTNITGGTSAMYGIAAGNAATSHVYGNTVANMGGGGICYCLHLMSNATANVYRNKVTGINGVSTNATVYGAYCNSASGTFNLYNNFFTDLTAPATSSNTGVNGIYGAAGTVNAYNNTIVLGKAAAIVGGANFSCAGIYSSSPLLAKNNIIYVNATPTGTGVAACIKRNTVANAVGSPPLPAAFTADNNIYYINPGVQNYIYEENITAATVKNGYALSGLTVNATNNIVNDPAFNKQCGAYKTFMLANGERSSYYENNMAAVSSGIYAPVANSYAESGGQAIATVTDDYLGILRSSPPDVGALQFSGAAPANGNPVIAYAPLPNVSFCAPAQVLAATIVAAGSNLISTTAPPRMYYKKTTENNVFGTYPADNAAAFNGWKYVTATGTAPGFSFAIDYTRLFSPIAANDTIQYFVVAEDNASTPNTGINAASFNNAYCLTGVNIPPAAGGTAAAPANNRFIIRSPFITINGSRDTVCKNAVRAMAITTPAGNYSNYSWSPVTNLYTDAAATIPYTGTNAVTVYVKQPAAGTTVYTVSASNGVAACAATATDTIVVQALDTLVTGSANFCAGDSVTITAAAGYTYQWLNNGAAISGANAAAYTVLNSGSYAVALTNAQGCRDTSSAHAITANPKPALTITGSADTICRQLVHAISVTSPAGNYGSYIWSPATNLFIDPAATIPYTGTSAVTVYTKQASPGTTVYTVTASTAGRCASLRTDTITVRAIDTVVTGARDFCAGDSITLVAGTGYAYQWLSDGTAIPGAASSTYTVHSTAIYSVRLVTAQGCIDTSIAYMVVAHPLPVPVITLNGTNLETGTYATYQWSVNGNPIPGATGSSIPFTLNNSYTVTVTDVNGCQGTSDPFFLNQGGVGTVGSDAVKVYPNPARNELHIQAAIPVRISIVSLEGQTLLQADNTGKLDISGLADGLYLIRITDKNGQLLRTDKLLKKA